MKTHGTIACSLILLVAFASLAGASGTDGLTHAYSRGSGPRTGFAIDEAFLTGNSWDLKPLAGRPVVSQPGDPVGDDAVVLSREALRAGKVTVNAGEFPAVLVRETVQLDGGKTAVQYRWKTSGEFTLALVRGPEGSEAPHFQQVDVVMQLEGGAPPTGIRVHTDEIAVDIYRGIHYSLDLVPEVNAEGTEPLTQLDGFASGGALLAATTWDFSSVDTAYPDAARVAETTVPIRICNGGTNDGLPCDATDAGACPGGGSCDPDFGSSCNAARCGYSLPESDYISWQESFDAGTCEGPDSGNGDPCAIGGTDCSPGNVCMPVRITAVQEREDTCFGGTNPGTPCPAGTECTGGGICGNTIWLRAGAQNEGSTSTSPSEHEGRFCYDGQLDENGELRGNVVQWQFEHPDGSRRYMQLGDSWASSQFDCTLNLFNQACGNPVGGLITAENNTANGGFTTGLLTEGNVKLPSGHWFDVLVARQVASFQVFFASGCGFFPVQTVLQPVVIFLAPNLGSVVQINGPLEAVDDTNWTTINETRIRFGLFPPLSTSVQAVGTDSITIDWNPGNQQGFIDRAKIYWDTDSGSGSTYAFNSDTHPGQVSFGAGSPPTSATISGLTPGQTYFFTVTLLDSFTEFDGSPTVEYESLLFPTTASGTDDLGTTFTYPQEVSAAPLPPDCTP
ncbi:MAG: fibronectin type III domain-containing protein, partial [Planctomycetota bacterium]